MTNQTVTLPREVVEQLVEALADMVARYGFTEQAKAALTAGREALQTQGEMVPQAWTNLLAYVLQDDMHNSLTPRVVDIAYTAFTLAKRPNIEDGGASDWFNDTKPKVAELIAKLRKDLIEEMPATHPQASEPAPQPAQGDLSRLEPFVQGLGKSILRELQSAQKAREE